MKLLTLIKPTEMRCPHCGRFHVDREEWVHRAHHTHLCEHCDGEFEIGWGHYFERGVPPFTMRARARALVHKAQDVLGYVLAAATSKWRL